TDRGIRLCELGDALLGRALALATHCFDQPLAMQGRSNHPGRRLERRQLRRIDGAPLARIVEADDPEESSLDEDRHHSLALRVDAVEIRAVAVELRWRDAETPTRSQLRAQCIEALLVAQSLRRMSEMRLDAIRHPLARDDEPALAIWTGKRLHEIDAIGAGCLAQHAQHIRHG